MRLRSRLLFAAVLSSGAVTLAWHINQVGAHPSLGVAALVAASFLSGFLIVELSSVSAESVTYALVAAALLQFGPAASVVVAAAGEIGSAIRPPRPKVHRSGFNIGAHAIAAAAQGLVFVVVGWHPGNLVTGAALLLPASLVYFGVSSGLIAWGIGWSGNIDPISFWKQSFRWIIPHYPALGLIGTVLARGQQVAGPFGVLVFCLPLLMSHYSVDIFVRRTREQMEQLEKANSRLNAVNGALTETLSSVVDARDLYLYRHSHQASNYTECIARRLAVPEEEIQLAKQGALLHDIGKIGIPEAILRKPGPLDDEERTIMNSHAEIGAEIVARTRELAPVAAIVRAHHERYDGAGYPDGLKGEEIPRGARIICVLESFDAMISDRPYRKGMSFDDAIAEIKRCSGTQFDPEVVRAFLGVIREDGTDWLSNSATNAGSVGVDGADLFLPKALNLNGHGRDSSERRSDGEHHEGRSSKGTDAETFGELGKLHVVG